jgi:hypothetical protein
MSVDFTQPPSSASIPDASESVKGKIRIATSAEATAGTDDLTAMTPLKVQSVVNTALVGGVTYQGTFDASSPADLSNASKGDLYIISVAGTYQGQSWAVGDHLLINADMGGTLDSSKIDKVDNTDAVTSVAGRTGAVTLSTADVSGLSTVASTGAYSDLSGTPTLGTAAALDVGTSATNVVQLDGTGKLPAVDGSQLINLPSGASALGDLTDVTITAAATGEVLRYDGAEWVDAQLAYSDLSNTPTLGTASAEDVGTSAGNVVQLDGSARLPAVDGSQLINLPSSTSFYTTTVSSTSTAAQITTNRRQHYNVITGGITLTIPSAGGSAAGGLITIRNGASTAISVSSPTTTLIDGTVTTSFNVQPKDSRTFVWLSTSVLAEVSATRLEQLGDVSITSAATGEVLRYNGSAWVDAQLAYSDLSGAPTNVSSFTNDAGYLTDITAENLGDLANVDLTGLANGDVIIYNSTSGKWEANPPPAPQATTTSVGLIEIAENAEATAGTAADKALVPSNISSITTAQLDNSAGTMLESANNLSDLANAATARTNLGLGTAAVENVGTSAGNVVQLNGSAQLPALDGSLLTGVTADLSGATLDDISDVSYPVAPANDQLLQWNSSTSKWEPVDATTITSVSPGSTYSVTTHKGLEEVYLLTPSVDCTVSIPTASTVGAGFKYNIKNLSANTITINATIDGTSGLDITTQYSSITIVSDGTNWYVI